VSPDGASEVNLNSLCDPAARHYFFGEIGNPDGDWLVKRQWTEKRPRFWSTLLVVAGPLIKFISIVRPQTG